MRRSFIELFRFALVGGFATALHYGIYYALWRYAAFNENVAYTAGYVLSFIANFYLTAYFTFRSRPSWRRAGGFGGAHLVNYLLHMGLLNLFLRMGLPEQWAPLPVFAIAIPVNFLLVRFVFKHKAKDKA